MSHLHLGFALTQHCNLRCAHCIRDDVTSYAELDIGLVLRTLTEARSLFGPVAAGFTGGEPTLHRSWPELVTGLGALEVPYTFVSNGWHMRRLVPLLDRYPPYMVRLSLSGADEAVHDAERGRDSFRRVLLATAILTSRRIPVVFSMIVDKRTRHQLEATMQLAESLGIVAARFILPQPVPASAERSTDLGPEEWWQVRRELADLAASRQGGTRLIVDYGAPFLGEPYECDSFTLKRIYVDVHGRISTCCQLSDYGANEADVVANLHEVSFAEAHATLVRRMNELREASAPRGANDQLAAFPCLRCARASGKMEWLRHFPDSPWAFAADSNAPADGSLVSITYSRRARRVVSVVA